MEALAAADDGEVMAAWAGLGYYARARNLLACARAVARDHGGVFPDGEEALRALPGVGAYTAAAIAAIAFDRPANVVDGNVERVMARLFAVETPLPAAKPELTRLAETLVKRHRPGDWAQALMDLGATICRPAAPLCDRCPLAKDCRARATGAPETYPRRSPKARRPHRHGAAFALTHAGEIALVRRPPRGLLGGMLGLPTTDWRAAPWTKAEALARRAGHRRLAARRRGRAHLHPLFADPHGLSGLPSELAARSNDLAIGRQLPSVFFTADFISRGTIVPSIRNVSYTPMKLDVLDTAYHLKNSERVRGNIQDAKASFRIAPRRSRGVMGWTT